MAELSNEGDMHISIVREKQSFEDKIRHARPINIFIYLLFHKPTLGFMPGDGYSGYLPVFKCLHDEYSCRILDRDHRVLLLLLPVVKQNVLSSLGS